MLTRAAKFAAGIVSGGGASKQASDRVIHVVPEPPVDGSVSVHKIDYASYGFEDYNGSIALVIDNIFSQEECLKILSVTGGATIESDEHWEVAAINGGPGSKGVVYSDYRNGQRIIKDDFATVEWMLERLRPHIKDIEELDEKATKQWFGRAVTGRAKLVSINERLRFLRYGIGGFFRKHQDGQYSTPDHSQRSVYTIQIYLNGSAETLEGGATRVYSLRDSYASEDFEPLKGPALDVPPRPGRCFIFEQRRIMHTGEPVTKGIKVTVRTEFMYSLDAASGTKADDE